MATTMTFTKIKAYLDAIADNPSTVLPVDGSPHGRFWNVLYQTFITGNVPGNQVRCNNAPVPIIDRNHPERSPFYLILTSATGFCNMPQMPAGGAYITDAGYQATLNDGSIVQGGKIAADMLEWLSNGYPEG